MADCSPEVLAITSDSASQHADTSEQDAVEAYTDSGRLSTAGASKAHLGQHRLVPPLEGVGRTCDLLLTKRT